MFSRAYLEPEIISMAANARRDDLGALRHSVSRATRYPSNLVRTHHFPYSLSAYRRKLDEDDEIVFRDRKSDIVIWDLLGSEDGK